MHTSMSALLLTMLESTRSAAVQAQPHMRRPMSLNAFDIIASSSSLDLSGFVPGPKRANAVRVRHARVKIISHSAS
jgi:5'-AMP-activated protein kinase catalytic alpha subunit